MLDVSAAKCSAFSEDADWKSLLTFDDCWQTLNHDASLELLERHAALCHKQVVCHVLSA